MKEWTTSTIRRIIRMMYYCSKTLENSSIYCRRKGHVVGQHDYLFNGSFSLHLGPFFSLHLVLYLSSGSNCLYWEGTREEGRSKQPLSSFLTISRQRCVNDLSSGRV